MARHPEVYQTKEWRQTRKAVIVRANGLCERCKPKGKIVKGKEVHHKIYLTEDNKTDYNIAFGLDNLEYLCADCHNNEHDRSTGLQGFLIPPG